MRTLVRLVIVCLLTPVIVFTAGFASPGTGDETPPALCITSPPDGDIISTALGSDGGKVSVTVTATDDGPAPVAVVVRLNDQIVATDGDVSGESTIDIALKNHYWLAGTNTIAVTAIDAAGNSASAQVAVYYDVNAPLLTLNRVATPTNAASAVISGVVEPAEAGATVSVTWPQSAPATSAVSADGSFSITVPLSEGPNLFSVAATDGFGNVSAPAQATIVRDSSEPTITLSAPAVTATPDIRVSGTAGEVLSDLRYSLDGGATVSVPVAGDATFAAAANLASEGIHVLTFTAIDAAGNFASKQATVKYDAEAPFLTILDIPPFTGDGRVAVEGTAEPGSTVTVKVDGVVAGVFPVASGGAGAFAGEVQIAGSDGEKAIGITAQDPSTGLSSEVRHIVTLDTTAPTITVNPVDAATSQASVTISGSASEIISALFLNDVPQIAGADAKSFSIDVPIVAGENTFTIDITDRAGNTASTQVFVTGMLPSSPEPALLAESAVTASAGGIARNAGAGVDLTVPAGAAPSDILARVYEDPETENLVTGFDTVRICAVEFKDAATAEPVSALLAPYTLKIACDAANAQGIDTGLLATYFWSEPLQVWVEIPATFDSESCTFTLTTPRAAKIAVLADKMPGARPALAGAPSGGLRGSMWLCAGTAPAGATVEVVVNDVMQASVTATSARRWQAWVTLRPGENSVYAAVTGAFPRASAEVRPKHVPLVLTDIAGHWAERYVRDLVDRNIITGYEDDTFRTENDITRAEFCTLMVRALGLEPDSSGAEEFADFAGIAGWARPFVGAATRAGLVNGFDDNTFRAGEKITRVEMATIISRGLGLKGVTTAQGTPATFADAAAIPDWAFDHVARTSGYGIIRGYADSTFGPGRPATRAESATMVMRFLDLK